ncbi:tautomerase family protein [Ruegeria aquimaris]|uniref:Tautomerase family protein n=1 Tax=Ruegeria aquimaris TaxID=2984333 RepID=A0ABT3AME0_9RHOB|nr:tautomerase family protein [Ruegeria sp. XHP0148]MCV2889848.1 tautomerase family protein [Ruegeria sp. XHP0148]
MPYVQISMRAGTSDRYKEAIFDGIYRAMTENFDVPEDDQFMTITEHEAATFRYGARYLGIARTDALVFIRITANNTRSLAQKQALFAQIAALLADDPGLRPEDVFINLVEVGKENWSLGNGIAQYA